MRKGLSKRLVIAVTLLVIIAFAGLELTGVTHIFHKKPPAVVSGSSFNTKGEPKSTKSSETSSNPGVSSASNSKSTGSSTAVLITPSGDFVSNHHPNLSGSPAPNTMSSVCNTTPGASCQITFTKDGVVKSLPLQTADSNGSVYWSWKLQDIGITAGTWKIQAVVSLSGQTKTASDALDLTVAP